MLHSLAGCRPAPSLIHFVHSLVFLIPCRQAEAGELFDEAIAVMRRHTKGNISELDPNLAKIVASKAVLLKLQGNNAEAETMFREALETLEAALGFAHPDVATGRCNLAAMLMDQGKYDEAEPMLRAALQVKEKLQVKNV